MYISKKVLVAVEQRRLKRIKPSLEVGAIWVDDSSHVRWLCPTIMLEFKNCHHLVMS